MTAAALGSRIKRCKLVSAAGRGRPGRSGRRGRSRSLFGRHGRRRGLWRRLRPFLGDGGLLGGSHRGRRRRAQLDKNRIWHKPRRLRLALGYVGIARLGRAHHPHRHGLRLVAGQREVHRELIGAHRERAGGAAGLSHREFGLGAGGLGLELHGCRRSRQFRQIELQPAWSAGAGSKAQCAGCNCDNSFHDRYRPLMRPNGRVPLATCPAVATTGTCRTWQFRSSVR